MGDEFVQGAERRVQGARCWVLGAFKVHAVLYDGCWERTARCTRVSVAVVAALALFSAATRGQTETGLTPANVIQQIAELLERSDLAAAETAVTNALGQHANDPALHNFAGVVDAQQHEYT